MPFMFIILLFNHFVEHVKFSFVVFTIKSDRNNKSDVEIKLNVIKVFIFNNFSFCCIDKLR